MAGGSAHPGPGMPMVLMSGWIAGDCVDQDQIVDLLERSTRLHVWHRERPEGARKSPRGNVVTSLYHHMQHIYTAGSCGTYADTSVDTFTPFDS